MNYLALFRAEAYRDKYKPQRDEHDAVRRCLGSAWRTARRCGPFTQWRHEHTFTALANGQTRMVDVVEFQSPFGPPVLADGVVLGRCLSRLLRRRDTWLKNTLEEHS